MKISNLFWTTFIIIFFLISLASVFIMSFQKPINANENEVTQVFSFTLEGCGTCITADQEIEKLKELYPDFNYVSYSVYSDTAMLEAYGIEQHPTVLFLNHAGQELGRVERDNSLADYTAKIQSLQEQNLEPITSYQVTPPSGSTLATLYYYNNAVGKYSQVNQFIEQKTSVKYPKIATIHKLFSLSEDLPDTLENPFEKIEFVEMRGQNGITTITLSDSYSDISQTVKGIYIAETIALTMLSFADVDAVQIISNGYESEVFTFDMLEPKVAKSNEYVYEPKEDWSPNVAVYEYNMNILHHQDIKQLPCYCGCEKIGHTSNHNCFFSDSTDDRLIDQHGEYCNVCLDITNTYMNGKKENMSIQQIQSLLKQMYEL
ncbi:PCYCGC motif-containing (lipo)protein [Bacillus alkalicellulosilyticus]|uniref:PCYCGC motif-containing (lipo)protein n=1 Tax=Alkalihalobacterium alkalicellulosilyticum TaxID=1912214 RepID=UPI0009965259|nr:PCYCGC motif-containing (lipo)protein [Bacillus alkalicellulosilyticus]